MGRHTKKRREKGPLFLVDELPSMHLSDLAALHKPAASPDPKTDPFEKITRTARAEEFRAQIMGEIPKEVDLLARLQKAQEYSPGVHDTAGRLRQTGRTRYSVCEGLMQAVAGRRVLFFCATAGVRDYVHALAEHVLGAPIAIDGQSPAFSGRFTIRCADTSGREAEQRKKFSRGDSQSVVMYDHYWPRLGRR